MSSANNSHMLNVVGDRVFVVNRPTSLVEIPDMPVGTYVLAYDAIMSEFYLQQTESFQIPDKVYGQSPLERINKIIKTYLDKPAQMGVLLKGAKGSGKTLLTKLLSKELAAKNISTVIVNKPFAGDEFNAFISNLPNCLIIFDEYEKIYRDIDLQENLLTLLDGTVSTKKLFLFTVNEVNVSRYFRNRPGRIYYEFAYTGVDAEFIKEYCLDKLDTDLHEHIEAIQNLTYYISELNFDILKAVVEEMNRYKMTVGDTLKDLNVQQENTHKSYNVTILINDELIDEKMFELIPKTLYVSPLTSGVQLDFRRKAVKKENEEDEDDDVEYIDVDFRVTDLKSVSRASNRMIFQQTHPELGKVEIILKENYTAPVGWVI